MTRTKFMPFTAIFSLVLFLYSLFGASAAHAKEPLRVGTGYSDHLHQSKHTVQEVGKVEQALGKIQSAVTTINDMNNQIASAAEEQTTVSETINQNVHQIVVIAQGTAADTQQAALITRQLAKLASELDQLVSSYRT
jgi:methyl-accepting chemotaxis protein